MLRKINDEIIDDGPISSYEKKFVEKQKAEAAAEKQKFNNKPVKYIKQGVSGKNLKK